MPALVCCTCLGGSPFRYWASKRLGDEELWECCFLLHIDPDGDRLSRDEFSCLNPCFTGIPPANFEVDECQVWPFRCCADVLKQDVNGWISTILDKSGDAMLFGSDSLRVDLLQHMTEAGLFPARSSLIH